MRRVIRAFGLVVAIEAEDDRIFALLDRQLPPFPLARAKETPHLVYRLTQTGVLRDRIAVLRGRRMIVMAADLSWASKRLVSDFQSTVARLASGWTFVHAGVVAIGGRALLLPARSGAGKTTLVAALVRAGAAYGSDELAVLDAEGRVYPYSRQLAMRTPERSIAHVSAHDLGEGRVMSEARTAAAVIFTEFRQNESIQLQSVSPTEMVLRLLAHCPGVRGRPGDTLAALLTLARGTPAFASLRGDAETSARALIEWVSSRQQSAE